MREVAQREDIRDIILDAVDALLARYGYKKMTMDDVAREVGIGKGTIYLHFVGKEDLTLSHIDRIVERLCEQLEEIAGSHESPDARIRAMLQRRVLYRFDCVQHYTQSLNDLLSALRPSLLLRRQRHFQQEMDVFVKVLEEGRRSRLLRVHDAAETAYGLLLATNSLLPYSLSPAELGERKLLEKEVTQVANLLLTGLQARNKKRRLRRV
jgi:AcrR family transcriptional regulator